MNYQFKDVWHYYGIVRNFKNHSKADQDETVAFFLQANSNSRRYYWFVEGIQSLVDLVPDKAMELAKTAFKTDTAGNVDSLAELLEKIMPRDKNNEIKDIIFSSDDHSISKLALMYDGLTVEQEVKALKNISLNKYCPSYIYKKRYVPRMEALEQLPPVGRLKVLETLLSNDHLSYNIFGDVKDPEEFKRLIFGSVLRHRDRGEVIWKKYQEAVNLGTPGMITLKGTCENCGQFEVNLKSSRTRTSVGFKRTYLARYIDNNRCVLCGRNTDQNVFIEEEKKLS